MKSFTNFFSFLILTLPTIINSEHFYTTDPHGELAPGLGYHVEGIACYVSTTSAPNTMPIYRWMNPSQGLHFYTSAASGELAPSLGYDYEGIAYYVFAQEEPGSTEWYRWRGDGHFYSTNAAEGANAGFVFEGVVGFVYPVEENGWVPLYRWYNNK